MLLLLEAFGCILVGVVVWRSSLLYSLARFIISFYTLIYLV